jgi:hypothetical protein
MLDNVTDYLGTDTGFGTAGTLAGAAVSGVFSVASQLELAGGVITQAPTWDVATTDAAAVVPGTVAVINGTTYTVRQAQLRAPDGAITTLVLARGAA